MLNRALLERYRCSESLADFSLIGELSPNAGYFKFGANAVCYGLSAVGSRSPEMVPGLYDTDSDVKVRDAAVSLPFDPNSVIDNLRLERYASDHNLNGTQPLGRKALRLAYYSPPPP